MQQELNSNYEIKLQKTLFKASTQFYVTKTNTWIVFYELNQWCLIERYNKKNIEKLANNVWCYILALNQMGTKHQQ